MCIYSAYTAHILCIYFAYTLHTLCTTVYTLYVYSTYTVRILYIYCAYIVHIQYLHCAHTEYILYIYSTYTAHILYIYCAYTVHIVYIYCPYTVHILCIYCTYTVHIFCIHCTYTVHILYIYTLHILYIHLRILYIYCTFTVYILYIYCEYTVYILYIHCAHTVHILYVKCTYTYIELPIVASPRNLSSDDSDIGTHSVIFPVSSSKSPVHHEDVGVNLQWIVTFYNILRVFIHYLTPKTKVLDSSETSDTAKELRRPESIAACRCMWVCLLAWRHSAKGLSPQAVQYQLTEDRTQWPAALHSLLNFVEPPVKSATTQSLNLIKMQDFLWKNLTARNSLYDLAV